MKYRVELLREK